MVNQTESLDLSCVNLGTEENQETTKDRRYSGDLGIEEKAEFEVLDGENQEIQANLCDTLPEDLILENAILTNFPDGCDRSFTVESKDEDLYDIIPKNLTLTKIINILNQAIREDDCEELDRVVQNIENYEGRSIILDNVNLKSFCEQQLNLDLRGRSDHQHIYSNILSQYNFDQENFKCDYLVKELVLMAIVANDKLIEQYQGILFAEGNLSLLPLLVGGQKYIEAFIEKFHGTDGIYEGLKDQAIQLVEPNKINFFSVIALRKEQNLLDKVLVEYVLKDLKQVLKTSNPDPLYGVLETASLIKHEEFIMIVLGALERYINEPTKKASTEELLKKSFATLLETAISQEHVSIVEYLCREHIEKKGLIIQEIYKEAFADKKVIEQIKKQVLKNIDSAGNGRKEKKQKIYDLVLQAASYTGSIDFITKVLDLIEKSPKFLSDTDFLQSSLITILDNATRGQHSSVIQNVYTNFISKLVENSEEEFLTIQQRYQKACHTSISVNNSVASQLNEKEPNRDDSNLEQNEFEIPDIQEERRPYALGSNKSKIAGFSQEKLLEIINFVKIGYYVCDFNYNNGKFSELESRGYKVPGQLRKEGYKVVQFYNMNDGKQYRHAGSVFIKDKEITITYRGSRNGFDYRKDAEMILTSSDELLPKGGKIHSGFYSLFKDSWSSVYEILKGHANDQQLEIKDFKINLTGHSMGGAIANIAALCLSVTEGAEDLHVATFASPRVFDSSAAEIYKERLGKKTIRVVNQSDFIPSLPFGSMGYKHVGEQLVITSRCSLQRAHLLDTYRNLIANIESDQLKSDNSVSIYYYPSYLATVLYNVFTAPSYLILNIRSNDDEQYFKQVKNKHKGASLSEMMKYSGSNNEQKVVIYEDSEPSENGFITFHILRNTIGGKNLLMIPPTFNPNIEHRIIRSLVNNSFTMMPSLHRYGRSTGLKVNLLDTAFFVNDDYYLSGDTISPRLLKTLVDNYPGNLALENANSQRVEDNVLALTKESDIISGIGQKPVRNKSMRSGFMNPIDNYPKSQFDNKIPSTIQIDEVEVGSTTTNDQSTSIINSNNTDNVQQESTIVAKESEELAAEISQGTSVENGVTKNDNVQGASTTTTSNDGEDKQPPVQQAIPMVLEKLTVQTAQDTSVRDDITKNASLLASVSNDNNHSDSSKTQSNLNNGSVTAPYVQPAGPESVDKNSGKKDTQPKQPGVPLVASKDSKLLSDAQGNGEQSSYPGKNNSAPQNAKSKLPVIAASMLAITGVATGIAVAVYLEMLAVGIAVGACCLVAAAIVYCYSRPSSSLENSNVQEKIARDVT